MASTKYWYTPKTCNPFPVGNAVVPSITDDDDYEGITLPVATLDSSIYGPEWIFDGWCFVSNNSCSMYVGTDKTTYIHIRVEQGDIYETNVGYDPSSGKWSITDDGGTTSEVTRIFVGGTHISAMDAPGGYVAVPLFHKESKVTLSYSANGGSNAPDSQSLTPGTAGTISTSAPVRSGYSFLGWSTSATGSAQYQPGDSITIDADTTLYAVWALPVHNGTVGPTNSVQWIKQ